MKGCSGARMQWCKGAGRRGAGPDRDDGVGPIEKIAMPLEHARHLTEAVLKPKQQLEHEAQLGEGVARDVGLTYTLLPEDHLPRELVLPLCVDRAVCHRQKQRHPRQCGEGRNEARVCEDEGQREAPWTCEQVGLAQATAEANDVKLQDLG